MLRAKVVQSADQQEETSALLKRTSVIRQLRKGNERLRAERDLLRAKIV